VLTFGIHRVAVSTAALLATDRRSGAQVSCLLEAPIASLWSGPGFLEGNWARRSMLGGCDAVGLAANPR
jgi:hypothetical protein